MAEKETLGFFPESVYQVKINSDRSKKEKRQQSVPKLGLKELIIDAWKQRDDETTSLNNQIAKDEESATNLSGIVDEAHEIATVRKDNVFASKVTEEEQHIINQRVALQQKHFQEYVRREINQKVSKIKTVHSYITEDEVVEALKHCDDNEEEVCVFLTDYSNLQQVRKDIAMKAQAHTSKEVNNNSDNEDDEEEKFVSRKRKRSSPRKSRRGGNSKEGIKYAHHRKLRLDDALAQGSEEGWSEARIKAYKQREANPNAYYYRFNEPGQKQRNGKWSKDEIALFYKRMDEVGVNGQWGIFSIPIPGRVGYQCSNYYRHLVETNQVQDPNYYLDDKGKAHYLFKGHTKTKKKRSGSSGDEDNTNDSSQNIPHKVKIMKREKSKRKKAKKNDSDDEEDEGDDDDYRPSVSRRRSEAADSDKESDDEEDETDPNNPLPGFIDPVTLEEVNKPAISPFGHVMSYSTWVRCLTQEPRNRCPFTKQTIKIRDLVRLNWENLSQYKEKIVNWPKDT